MTHRMTLGHLADVAESAALNMPDNEAEKRMVDAIDYKADQKARKNRIDTAIRRLSKTDRAFVRGILSGKDWRKMSIAKSTFSDRLKKVEKLLSYP